MIVLEEEELDSVGSKAGTKNIERIRKDVDNMFLELGHHCRKAYRMSPEEFVSLHALLEEKLREKFSKNEKAARDDERTAPNGIVPTKLRLSCAIRYFAGAAVYDLILSHGMGRSTTHTSVWGVVDVVNETDELAFNKDNAPFPSLEEQDEIAEGFHSVSTASFDTVIGAIDGMLVWIVMPDKKTCRELNTGQITYHCARKDKYGVNLLAICDQKKRFRWASVMRPARSSDYLSFTSSLLPRMLENGEIQIRPGYTLIGDNAFVKKFYMAVPFHGDNKSRLQDSYNFYLSQLRINIECAFGILVHRWGILRRPLSCNVKKVGALTMALMRLHNYCINSGCGAVHSSTQRDSARIAARARQTTGARGEPGRPVELDDDGRPTSLLGSGHHFTDVGGRRPPVADDARTPMDAMVDKIESLRLGRPGGPSL